MNRLHHLTTAAIIGALVLVLLAPSGCTSAEADTPAGRSAGLASLIASLNRSALEPLVDDLTGETPALVGGAPFSILTRSVLSGHSLEMAQQYVHEQLLEYGLDSVHYQTFMSQGVVYRNVIADVPGVRHPEQIVLIGAHLDSQSGPEEATLAPGADDNASGVAAALSIARALAHERLDRTVRFVFFDSEEHGHLGSFYYANKAKEAGERIHAMITTDMLAYNEGSSVLGLHARKAGEPGASDDRSIAQAFVDAAVIYAIDGVEPKIRADGSHGSDHQAFWLAGYPAIMVVQDLNQFDPRRHTTRDTAAHFVWSYYVAAARVTLGGVATLAGFVNASPPTTTATGIDDGAWYNRAMPVTLTATSVPGGAAVAHITYSVDGAVPFSVSGATVRVTVPETGAANGRHTLAFHAVDSDENAEADRTVTVNLDTVRPTTQALAPVSVRRRGTARITFRVDDALPNGGTADVLIKIRDAAGDVVESAAFSDQLVNRPQKVSIRVSLPRGAYRYTVQATDVAGNRQAKAGGAALLVK